MANVLSFDRQVAVIAALAEGMGIRPAERMLGVHRDTIMRLGVRVGQGCRRLLGRLMRDLSCKRIQLDELWSFIQKKQRNVSAASGSEVGDAWTFVAIDADTKLIPAFLVGKRDGPTANTFIADLASRLRNRVQISSDALAAYVEAIERGFGGDVDYGQIVKTYDPIEPLPANSRYSPPPMVSVRRSIIVGDPDEGTISTSYIERQNLTVRMHCRRQTRLTNAFSKKLENFKAAVALHFGYYNLVKVHRTLRMTPALAAGVVPELWSVADLVDRAMAQTA